MRDFAPLGRLGYIVDGLRSKLTYANVMSTVAVFVALGGSSYAALSITGRDVKNSSLTYKDLKRNTLGGSRIKESRLGTVPRARNAAKVGGLSAGRLLLKCPAGTLPTTGTCTETAPRSAAPYGIALGECQRTGTPKGAGRRLPTHQELLGAVAYQQIVLTAGGELTSNVYPGASAAAPLKVLVMTDETGGATTVDDTFAGRKPYRCVVDPLN